MNKNCFLTLTFDNDNLKVMCPDGSINKKHMQDFMKRVRKKFVVKGDDSTKLGMYYVGEYGEKSWRPHYHVILFNCDFEDKEYCGRRNGFKYYKSSLLRELWPYGNNIIGDVTFESAAYVARYVTKKITGDKAEEHYKGRVPEFGQASLKPALGKNWFLKYGKTDVIPFDEVVVRGFAGKPPRYYDKLFEREDLEGYKLMKLKRRQRGFNDKDSTYQRLQDREYCKILAVKRLVRTLDNLENVV